MEVKVSKINKMKKEFYKNSTNRIIQNSLCSNHLFRICEVRNYMQSRDSHFSNVLDPVLEVSNQGLSGRCWMFAFLNVIRHELVRRYQLPHDFELSESYLCFYEKIEKCNNFLTKFLDKDELQTNNLKVQQTLLEGCSDGGHWITCANLIRKYGIVPKTCFRESINSFDTETMNNVLNYKLREFAIQLTKEKDKTKRIKMKDTMLEQIFDMLSKMLGTPPSVNEKFTWSYLIRLDLNEQLERELKRQKREGQFENLQIKKTVDMTPLEFYKKFICYNLDDYMRIGNDPRKEYNKFYTSFEEDLVIGGERNGYYNLDMDEIAKICVNSILNNDPVEFDCDVTQYLNPSEELLDTKCYDYNLVFNTSFNSLSKVDMMNCLETYPNHAMIITGVDLDMKGNPNKWKIENSWGRDEESSGYYSMDHDWFKKFVFNIVVNKKYSNWRISKSYYESIKNPVVLPENDIMA